MKDGAAITSLVFLPLILAVIASALAWRRVSRPWLFLVASVLTMFGLQQILAPAAAAVYVPSSGLHNAVGLDSPFGRSLIAAAVVQLLIGLPFLWWLSRGLRKP